MAVPLQISSSNAVNVPPAVRLLISNPDQDQRGTIVNVPGLLTDILADAARNRFFVVRQDKNQVLVFDGASNQQKAVLRTPHNSYPHLASPTMESPDCCQHGFPAIAGLRPGYAAAADDRSLPASHYGRSVAQSNNATFVVVENDSGPAGNIDRLDLVTGVRRYADSLGIWENTMPPTSVLTPRPARARSCWWSRMAT